MFNSRSCNIRSNATSPSCSLSSLRVKSIKCPRKNSRSTVWCLRHQPWNTRGFFSKLNKAATLHYHLEDITPEELPCHKDALFVQDRTTLLHNLTNLPPTCGEICLQVLDRMVAKKHFLFSTDSYHPQSI